MGAPAPAFELIDQRGQRLSSADLRGKIVALNFLYTRCPMPEVCPRLAASFATLQRKFPDALGRDLMLVSITSIRSGIRLRYWPTMLNSGVRGMMVGAS